VVGRFSGYSAIVFDTLLTNRLSPADPGSNQKTALVARAIGSKVHIQRGSERFDR